MLTWRALQVRMLKESLPHMRAAGKGQVIITTSLVGFTAFPFTDAYSASKFALEGGHFGSMLPSSVAAPMVRPGVKLALQSCYPSLIRMACVWGLPGPCSKKHTLALCCQPC